MLGTFTDHPGFARVFMESSRALSQERRLVVDQKRQEYALAMEGLIGEAQDAGELRALDRRLTRLSVFGMVSWAYHWLDPAGRLDAEQIAAFMWDVTTEGVRPRG